MQLDVEKDLEKINIFQKDKINYDKKISIARNVSEMLTENIRELSESYNDINMRLLNCDMYYANIDEKFGSVVYYYKNNALYLKEESQGEIPDEQLVHECIHYLQNFSSVMKSNQRAGLSNFDEFKITGLGLNEAITQYITAMAMEKELKRIENGKISIVTNSCEYYKYMTSLVNQIIFLMGRETAIKSALNSNEKFEDDLYNTFEENTNKILKNFDNLLDENHKENKDEEKIINIYMQTQEIIYKTYFTKVCKLLTTKKEVDNIVQKIYEYEEIFGKVTGNSESGKNNTRLQYNKNFEEFEKDMDDKFYKKYLEIDAKMARAIVKMKTPSFIDRILNRLRQRFCGAK